MKWVYAQAAGGDQPTLLLLESPNLSAEWALDLLGPWMMEWGGMLGQEPQRTRVPKCV